MRRLQAAKSLSRRFFCWKRSILMCSVIWRETIQFFLGQDPTKSLPKMKRKEWVSLRSELVRKSLRPSTNSEKLLRTTRRNKHVWCVGSPNLSQKESSERMNHIKKTGLPARVIQNRMYLCRHQCKTDSQEETVDLAQACSQVKCKLLPRMN